MQRDAIVRRLLLHVTIDRPYCTIAKCLSFSLFWAHAFSGAGVAPQDYAWLVLVPYRLNQAQAGISRSELASGLIPRFT